MGSDKVNFVGQEEDKARRTTDASPSASLEEFGSESHYIIVPK